MGIRHDNRVIDFLKDELYNEVLDEKDVKQFAYYTTPHLSSVDPKMRATLKRIDHIWGNGDRFYKLAEKHYGNAKLWWVIAWYNTTPTEAHVKIGDLIQIPMPLERVMYMFNSPRM